MPQLPQAYSATQNDPSIYWNGGIVQAGTSTYIDTTPNANAYLANQTASTALARRQQNQALIPTGQANDEWNAYDNGAGPLQGASSGLIIGGERVEDLERKARQIKKEMEAGGKSGKKTLPPFVLKLLSFVEDPKNFDLIRWSDDGMSFIVIDEDGFEKTLIPELFKHQKYASFVRQLNMYGFHKRVGLSDNSMKASERKSKAPSEYHHVYFVRGHPDLLWLISKPKSKSKKGKKGDESADSGEEGVDDAAGAPVGQAGQTETGQLQTKDLQVVRDTVTMLKQQQQQIHGLISRLRQDQNQLYQQAVVFQRMHERHENSINAILSFLANVFRKQLEEQGGTQNVQDLLASIIPNAQIPQGSVVDLGDFSQQQAQAVPNISMSPLRRPQRLLPPIPASGNASTVATPTPNTSPAAFGQGTHLGQMGSITELGDADTPSPNYLQQNLQPNSHEGMMRIIQDTNAGASPSIDLPQMAARTPVNLSDDQRNRVIGMMSRQPHTPGSSSAVLANSPGGSPGGFSPLMPTALPPSLGDIQARQQDLEHVHRLQRDQRAKIEGLENLLGPLSPSGRVTPVSNNGDLPGGFFDSDQIFDNSGFNGLDDFPLADFSADLPGNPDGSDFNFSLDTGHDDPNNHWSLAAAGDAQVGASNTPSPAPTEEITREDVEDSPSRDAKRRRRG